MENRGISSGGILAPKTDVATKSVKYDSYEAFTPDVRTTIWRVIFLIFLWRMLDLLYDKEKYKEMILDAAETVLGYFGFNRTIYGDKKKTVSRKWLWIEELRRERERDIRIEMMDKK
jgi:hypothetical protein